MTDLFAAATGDNAPTTSRSTACAPTSPHRAERDGLLDVAYRTVDSPLGPLLLAATTAGLVRVAFEGEGHDAVLAALAGAVSPRVLPPRRRLDATARQLDEYFAGRRRAFDVPVDLRLAHGFRRDVLVHLRDIPYGTTESYAIVARAAGSPNAVRAAGTACATNPVPLVVPCHRVVRSDGSIGQYRGGVEAKRRAAGAGGGGVTPVDDLDWKTIAGDLDELGVAVAGTVLAVDECRAIADLYDDDAPVPLDDRHGPPPLRAGRVPLLRQTAARSWWPSCAPRAGRTSCRSPATGPSAPGSRRRGPTTSTTGWRSATPPARSARRRCCCATAPATGTPCTATSTATSCSRCRS